MPDSKVHGHMITLSTIQHQLDVLAHAIDPLQVSCCHNNIRHLGAQPVFATLIVLVSIRVTSK